MLISQWNRSTYSSQTFKTPLQNCETQETETFVKIKQISSIHMDCKMVDVRRQKTKQSKGKGFFPADATASLENLKSKVQ